MLCICMEIWVVPLLCVAELIFLARYLRAVATHQMVEAIRTLVPLERGAMGGSAIMIPVRKAPPKQKSMELNQQARGLLLDT